MGGNESRFEEIMETLEQAENRADLSRVLIAVRNRYDLANVGYQALRVEGLSSEELPIMDTCDPSWLKRYLDRDLVAIDPVARTARHSNLPFDWSTVDRSSMDAKRFFLEMSRFEIGRQGMAVPIHSAHGADAVFGFTSHIKHEAEWLSFRRRSMPELTLLGHYFHERALALAVTRSGKATLSRQMRNCLQLSAEGHNSIVIAEKLGLSIHTVRMHLNRARKQLNAQSREEAVAKALTQGLIWNRR